MFQNLPSLKALHAFEAAARHCSFNAAAAELSLSPGAIGYQVKQLETSLNLSLFIRRTRQLELTEEGLHLYKAINYLFRELDDEVAKILPSKQKSQLTVSVSTYFVTRWLSPRLGRFLNNHTDITFRLQHSVNNPDFAIEDVDLAIRWGDGNMPHSHSELLMEMPMIAVCAPSLLDDSKDVHQPSEIADYPLLFDQPGIDKWQTWLQLVGIEATTEKTGPVITDPNVRVQSAIDGQGFVLGNQLLQPEIENQKLIEPFKCRLEGYGYYLVFSKSATQKKAFKAFHHWIMQESDLWRADQCQEK